MACAHRASFRVYKRGPAPRYSFLPIGDLCPCGRFFKLGEPVGNLEKPQ